MQAKKQSRAPLLASVLVIAILAVALLYYYSVSSGRISSLQNSLDARQNQISGDSSSISSLQSVVSSQQSSIALQRSNISADQQLISTLNGIISANNATSSMDKATIASLENQLQAARALVSNLTAEVSNLTAVADLKLSLVVVNAQSATISGNGTDLSPFYTFSPSRAGYLLIEVSGATEKYLVVTTFNPTASNSGGATFEAAIGLTGTSPGVTYFIIPIVPGAGYTFSLVSNTSSDGTAVLTATYFY